MSYQSHELFGEEDILNKQEKRTFGAVCHSATGECIMIKRRDFFLRILKDETARKYLQTRVGIKNDRMNSKITMIRSQLQNYSNYLYNDQSGLKSSKDALQDILPNQKWDHSVLKNYVHQSQIQESPPQSVSSYSEQQSPLKQSTAAPLKQYLQQPSTSNLRSNPMSPEKKPSPPQFLQGFFPSETNIRSISPQRSRRQLPKILVEPSHGNTSSDFSASPGMQPELYSPLLQSTHSRMSISQINRQSSTDESQKMRLSIVIPPRSYKNSVLNLQQQYSQNSQQQHSNSSSKFASPLCEEEPSIRSTKTLLHLRKAGSMSQFFPTMEQSNSTSIAEYPPSQLQMIDSNTDLQQIPQQQKPRIQLLSVPFSRKAATSLPPNLGIGRNGKIFLSEEKEENPNLVSKTETLPLNRNSSIKLTPVKLNIDRRSVVGESPIQNLISPQTIQSGKAIHLSDSRQSSVIRNTARMLSELRGFHSTNNSSSKLSLIDLKRSRNQFSEETKDTADSSSISNKMSSVYFNQTLFHDRLARQRLPKDGSVEFTSQYQQQQQSSVSLLFAEQNQPQKLLSEKERKVLVQQSPIQQWQKTLLSKQSQSTWNRINSIIEKNKAQQQNVTKQHEPSHSATQLLTRVGTEFASILKQISPMKSSNYNNQGKPNSTPG